MNRLKPNDHPDELMGEWLVGMPDEKADQLLVEKVAFDMRLKLIKKRKEGRGGWHTAQCSNAWLKEQMVKHIEKGDMIDVINFAGMIHCRSALYGESA